MAVTAILPLSIAFGSEESRKLIRQGIEFYKKGTIEDYERALELFDKAANADPQDAKAPFFQGFIHLTGIG